MATDKIEAGVGVPGKVQPRLNLVANPTKRYTCTCCGTPDILEADMAPTRLRKDGTRGYSWCRACKRESVRISRIKVMADPERAARLRKREREAKRRKRATDPEAAERMRQQNRETGARIAADPEKRERRNRLSRERRARLKVEDPEGYQALLDKERERHARWLRRPGNRTRYREGQRMSQALQRMKRGAKVVGPRKDFVARERGGKLPLAPLAAFVVELVEARRREWALEDEDLSAERLIGTVCQSLGISERTFREWRGERRKTVQLDTVDRVLQGAGVLWWEVYDAERWPEEHRKARPFFVGKAA